MALEFDFDGIIATNTTIKRNSSPECVEEGGLSGEPLEKSSLEVIKFVVKESGGKLPVIGVGGILDPESAHRKLMLVLPYYNFTLDLFSMALCFPPSLVNSLEHSIFLALNIATYIHL